MTRHDSVPLLGSAQIVAAIALALEGLSSILVDFLFPHLSKHAAHSAVHVVQGALTIGLAGFWAHKRLTAPSSRPIRRSRAERLARRLTGSVEIGR